MAIAVTSALLPACSDHPLAPLACSAITQPSSHSSSPCTALVQSPEPFQAFFVTGIHQAAINAHTHSHTHIHSPGSTHTSQGQRSITCDSCLSTLFSHIRAFPRIWGSPPGLDNLASELHGFSCLCLTSDGITSMYDHTLLTSMRTKV